MDTYGRLLPADLEETITMINVGLGETLNKRIKRQSHNETIISTALQLFPGKCGQTFARVLVLERKQLS